MFHFALTLFAPYCVLRFVIVFSFSSAQLCIWHCSVMLCSGTTALLFDISHKGPFTYYVMLKELGVF